MVHWIKLAATSVPGKAKGAEAWISMGLEDGGEGKHRCFPVLGEALVPLHQLPLALLPLPDEPSVPLCRLFCPPLRSKVDSGTGKCGQVFPTILNVGSSGRRWDSAADPAGMRRMLRAQKQATRGMQKHSHLPLLIAPLHAKAAA